MPMDPKETEKAEAWLGDAVLALFARQWILDTFGKADGELQGLITSNQFLSRFGAPTAVEAALGRIWQNEGLPAAMAELQTRFLPEMIRHLRRQRPELSGKLPAIAKAK
jgi:hypothetical protein